MLFGKSVRIFLPDATVMGIRHAEIINRTGQAVACPRSRLDELRQWQETLKPGVYILFEARLGDSKPLAYIGESENVADRLLTHDRKKDFWNEVVIFSNKDDNLTKSHIKYLESRLEALAKAADRYQLDNGATPTLSSLSRSDRDAMEEFLEDQTDEGFVLKKGSTASKTHTDSLNIKLVKLKEQLIADGRLVVEAENLRLTEDLLMTSSSYAAALIAGTSRSGPQSWYAKNGKSLKELEDLALAGFGSSPLEGGACGS